MQNYVNPNAIPSLTIADFFCKPKLSLRSRKWTLILILDPLLLPRMIIPLISKEFIWTLVSWLCGTVNAIESSNSLKSIFAAIGVPFFVFLFVTHRPKGKMKRRMKWEKELRTKEEVVKWSGSEMTEREITIKLYRNVNQKRKMIDSFKNQERLRPHSHTLTWPVSIRAV